MTTTTTTGISTPSATAFSFPTMQPSSLAAATTATTSAAPAFSFVPPTTQAKSVGFSLPTTSTSTTAAPTGFTLPTTTTSTGFSVVVTSAPTGFSLPTTSTTTGFSLPTTPSKTDAKKVSFSLPSTTTATTSAVATTSTGFSLGGTTATSAGVPPPATMAYAQIEELLNKWTSELAEQEKVFNAQVSQINTWDKLLAENSSKLSKLHTTIKKVQQQQEKINFDLDLIASQKKELEEALVPLEKEYASAGYHPDVQREKMYHTAENIDAQIKKMCEDVKETIEHVNEAARSEKMHPVVLIGRVLNAQMNSLQWVDEHSTQLQAQIETMSRHLDSIKRDTDRSFISYS